MLTLMMGAPLKTDLVKRTLPAGGIAVDIAHVSLLDVRVGKPPIRERAPGRFRSHRDIDIGRVGLLERYHPDARDDGSS